MAIAMGIEQSTRPVLPRRVVRFFRRVPGDVARPRSDARPDFSPWEAIPRRGVPGIIRIRSFT
eukprot:40010-Prorocentrum_minimum.AAC.4